MESIVILLPLVKTSMSTSMMLATLTLYLYDNMALSLEENLRARPDWLAYTIRA